MKAKSVDPTPQQLASQWACMPPRGTWVEYEKRKADWLAANPDATADGIEAAAKRIAEALCL